MPRRRAKPSAGADALPPLVPIRLADQLAARRFRLRCQIRVLRLPEDRVEPSPLGSPLIGLRPVATGAPLPEDVFGQTLLVYCLEPAFAFEATAELEDVFRRSFSALREAAGLLPPGYNPVAFGHAGRMTMFYTDMRWVHGAALSDGLGLPKAIDALAQAVPPPGPAEGLQAPPYVVRP